MIQLPSWVAPVSVLGIVAAVLTAGIWIGAVNSDRANFKEFMKEIREKIDKIMDRLPSPGLVRESPLRLSELGEKISKRVGGKIWVKKVIDGVLPSVEGKRASEIERFCFDYVLTAKKSFDDMMLDLITDAAYENGIAPSDVHDVLAIELRDAVLQRVTPPPPTPSPPPVG